MTSSLAAGALSAALALAVVGPSAAAQPASVAVGVAAPSMPSDGNRSLSDLLLPYSPYLFDAVVTAGRSLAEITYGSRRYDPITRMLVVDDLTIKRAGFAMRVGEARIGADAAIYDDVAVDTRALPLDPTVRQVLQRLGRETVTGDMTISAAVNTAQADYDLHASLRLDGIGTLDLSTDLLGFHVMVPLGEIEGRGGNSPPEIAGRLKSARARFTDAGLAAALYDVVGKGRGLTAEQARATASMIAGIAVASLFNDIPGGDKPQLRQREHQWSAAVQAFLVEPSEIAVALDPAEPFDLSRIGPQKPLDADALLALNPTVASGPAPKLALRDPAGLTLPPNAPLQDVLATAQILVEGRGVPQDIERAVGLLLPPARADNRAAIALLARALTLDPGVKIPQDQLVGTYVALILAKADGLDPAEKSLAAIRSRLSPAEIAAAEDDAAQRWRQTPVGMQQRKAEVAAFQSHDWPAVRRLAFSYYEGVAMPRNVMRAYGWASIAAAGGDRIAATFRDELTQAVNSGRLVLPLDKAREATDDLWRLIIAEPKPVEKSAAPAATDTAPSPAAGSDSKPGTTAPEPTANAPEAGSSVPGPSAPGPKSEQSPAPPASPAVPPEGARQRS
ncbi:hypothetical protein [Jiella sp. M17.18]|uniref:hypothetical protein n=1 Tax=Jiella sp. M17.18 TaxID=3234247 RepID=UPI0034DF48B0